MRSRSWPRSRTRLGVVVKGKVGAKVRVKTGLRLKIKNWIKVEVKSKSEAKSRLWSVSGVMS